MQNLMCKACYSRLFHNEKKSDYAAVHHNIVLCHHQTALHVSSCMSAVPALFYYFVCHVSWSAKVGGVFWLVNHLSPHLTVNCFNFSTEICNGKIVVHWACLSVVISWSLALCHHSLPSICLPHCVSTTVSVVNDGTADFLDIVAYCRCYKLCPLHLRAGTKTEDSKMLAFFHSFY